MLTVISLWSISHQSVMFSQINLHALSSYREPHALTSLPSNYTTSSMLCCLIVPRIAQKVSRAGELTDVGRAVFGSEPEMKSCLNDSAWDVPGIASILYGSSGPNQMFFFPFVTQIWFVMSAWWKRSHEVHGLVHMYKIFLKAEIFPVYLTFIWQSTSVHRGKNQALKQSCWSVGSECKPTSTIR